MSDPSRTDRLDLVGSWTKEESPPCAQIYPQNLIFAEGTYRGKRGEGQGFVWWDAGIYRIEAPGRLVLGTATDALVTYEIRLDGDRLEVTDPDDCHFTYRRQPPSG
jgi:hypothetical protein